MTRDQEEELCRRFPELYRERGLSPKESAMGWGFPGWLGIITTLSEVIDHHAKEVGLSELACTGTKEKFGSLVYSAIGVDDFVRGSIRIASILSGRHCQVCEAPARLTPDGWHRTLCQRHEGIYQYGGNLLNAKEVSGSAEKNSPAILLEVVSAVIDYEVDQNGMPPTVVTADIGEDGVLRLESSNDCMRVAGMLAMLKAWSQQQSKCLVEEVK